MSFMRRRINRKLNMELINLPSHTEKVFYCKNPDKTDNERRKNVISSKCK